LNGGVIVSVYVAIFVSPPCDTPVIVTEYVPEGVLSDVVIRRVELHGGRHVGGKNVALAPVGKPDMDNVTLSGSPPAISSFNCGYAENPAFTVSTGGVIVSE